MDAYIVNYEGRQGRHPMACVCKIHIDGYIGRAITEAVTIPIGKNYAMRISPQPLQKAPPMPITQATTCFDDPEFESEWEAHKAENEAMRELLRILL